MYRIFFWWSRLNRRTRDSIVIPTVVIGFISSVLSIIGISLNDYECLRFWNRTAIVLGSYIAISICAYIIIGVAFKDSIKLMIQQTPVSVNYGDIFDVRAWRVIGFDTHFDTRADDTIISKNSLHGQLILKHGKSDEIKKVVNAEAKRLGLNKNKDGLYDFPLGTIIRYNSSVDNDTYLLLALTELNSDYESHSDMAKFEHVLMRMWREISRVYERHDIALPVLGTGITRFDDGPKEVKSLLRCMLCTLNSSGVNLKSSVKILLYDGNRENKKNISLYEYRDFFTMAKIS